MLQRKTTAVDENLPFPIQPIQAAGIPQPLTRAIKKIFLKKRFKRLVMPGTWKSPGHSDVMLHRSSLPLWTCGIYVRSMQEGIPEAEAEPKRIRGRS